jgi:fucose permease
MSEYMEVNLGFDVLKSALAIGVFWLSITLGRFVCNWLGRFMSIRAMVGMLAVGAAVVTFAAAFIRSEALIWGVTVLMGLFYSSQWPLMVGQTVKRHATHTGTSMALMVASGGIAMAVIPALLGLISENFGVFISQILPAFFFVIILVVYCFVARPDKA